MSTKIDFRAKYKEKYKEYCDLQEKARNETDIEKRNSILSKLNSLNLNLKALRIIFEEERLDYHFLDKMQLNDQQRLFDNIIKKLDVEKNLT